LADCVTRRLLGCVKQCAPGPDTQQGIQAQNCRPIMLSREEDLRG